MKKNAESRGTLPLSSSFVVHETTSVGDGRLTARSFNVDSFSLWPQWPLTFLPRDQILE